MTHVIHETEIELSRSWCVKADAFTGRPSMATEVWTCDFKIYDGTERHWSQYFVLIRKRRSKSSCYIERKLEKDNFGIPMTLTVLLSVVLPSFMMELSPWTATSSLTMNVGDDQISWSMQLYKHDKQYINKAHTNKGSNSQDFHLLNLSCLPT